MRKPGCHRIGRYLHRIQKYWGTTKYLGDLDNDFTPGMGGYNPIVCAERGHVINIVHGVDDRLDLAYAHERGLELVPPITIFAMSVNNSAVSFRGVVCQTRSLLCMEDS